MNLKKLHAQFTKNDYTSSSELYLILLYQAFSLKNQLQNYSITKNILMILFAGARDYM